ncbi:hypothetical protein CUC04_10325 [Prevotella intermedia]|uniref:Uncharacterized protein n=1 Tax=Prevotella intermedia TaxID=28131 RepID=A0A2G9ID94_PREIN|nr:hypothetical protein CUC04_10325 [Prevotella intermedia]
MQGKSGCFAAQKSRFRNAKSKLLFFFGIIFTKRRWFSFKTVLSMLLIKPMAGFAKNRLIDIFSKYRSRFYAKLYCHLPQTKIIPYLCIRLAEIRLY